MVKTSKTQYIVKASLAVVVCTLLIMTLFVSARGIEEEKRDPMVPVGVTCGFSGNSGLPFSLNENQLYQYNQ